MDAKHCAGCYNDDYNRGLGGAKECWHLKGATLIQRKRVHIDQCPPWNQAAELLPADGLRLRQPGANQLMDSHLRAFLDRWQLDEWEAVRDAMEGSSGVPTVAAPDGPDPEDLKPYLPDEE